MSLKIVFMGTPEFAKEFLEHVYLDNKFEITGVYTQSPKKSHRGHKINASSVHKFAKEKNLNVFCPTKFKTSDIDNIKKINPDVILVVAYGLVLPKEILSIPGCGSVNVHASLLPKWRGAAPIQRSIINGDLKTGISIMKVEEGLDEGPIYIQTAIKIEQNDNYVDIYNKLVDVGKSSLDLYFSGHQKFLPIPQNCKLATYAKKIEKNEMKILFSETAFIVHKKVCAFSPKPGAWFTLDSLRYKIFDTEFITEDKIKSFSDPKKLILSFKKDYLLIKNIQKDGKNVMSIGDFERGHPKELQNIKEKLGPKNCN